MSVRILRAASSTRLSGMRPDRTAAASAAMALTGSLGLRMTSCPASNALTATSSGPNRPMTLSYQRSSDVTTPVKPSLPLSQPVTSFFSTLAGRSEPSVTEGTAMCSVMTKSTPASMPSLKARNSWASTSAAGLSIQAQPGLPGMFLTSPRPGKCLADVSMPFS